MKVYVKDRSLVVNISVRNFGHFCVLVVLTALCLGVCTYQRPEWQYKLVKTYFRVFETMGVLEHIPLIRDLYRSSDFILNRKGLGLKGSEANSGRNPVNMNMNPGITLDSIGESFVRHVRRYDKDMDDYLDPTEFKKALKILKPLKFGHLKLKNANIEKSILFNLRCDFQPIDLKTMTKELTHGVGTNLHYLEGLFGWKQAHNCNRSISESLLINAFAPRDWDNVTIGDVYYIVDPPKDYVNAKHAVNDLDYLHSEVTNRYFPPVFGPSSPGAMVTQSLLSMFHKRAFPSTRHPPHGSTAVVRAVSEDAVVVAFRLHGEFQLNLPPNFPFWFTPSFFFGEIVLSRDLSRVLDFSMDIPPDRTLNVDMEWVQLPISGMPDDSYVEVDIGYVARMKVEAVNPLKSYSQFWISQISLLKAFSLLEVELYPFKKVPYYSYPEALSRARAEKKLVHTVVLWGSLDDQSC